METKEETGEHLLAFINWNRIAHWKELSLPEGKEVSMPSKNIRPFAYSSAQRIFDKYARKKSTLWILSLPVVVEKGKRTRFAPTLVAKIVVRCREDLDCPKALRMNKRIRRLKESVWTRNTRKHGKQGQKHARRKTVVAVAGEGSEFFQHNDMMKGKLHELEFVTSRNKRSRYRGLDGITNPTIYAEKIAPQLQSIRRLDSSSAEDLANYAGKVRGQTVFISYCHQDGKLQALKLARELVRKDIYPWLDGLALPRSRSTRRDRLTEERLNKLLKLGVWGSGLFIALAGRKYMEKAGDVDKLIHDELKWARKRQIEEPEFAGILQVGGQKCQLGRNVIWMSDKPAKSVARMVKEILSNRHEGGSGRSGMCG